VVWDESTWNHCRDNQHAIPLARLGVEQTKDFLNYPFRRNVLGMPAKVRDALPVRVRFKVEY